MKHAFFVLNHGGDFVPLVFCCFDEEFSFDEQEQKPC